MVSGAAPLAPETAEELLRRVPSVEVREGYGLTESSALVSSSPPGRVRLGAVGTPVPGIEVEIHEPDDDGVGEILVRSPSVMLGYWQAPELTAEVLAERLAAHRRPRPLSTPTATSTSSTARRT